VHDGWHRQQYERQRDELKAEINRLVSVEIKSKRKEVESQRIQIDEYKREREILNKKLSSSERSVHDIRDVIVFNHSCMKVLRNEINGFQATLKTQRDKMNNLLHDKVSRSPCTDFLVCDQPQALGSQDGPLSSDPSCPLCFCLRCV
jgi:chromosome segregation ATPase